MQVPRKVAKAQRFLNASRTYCPEFNIVNITGAKPARRAVACARQARKGKYKKQQAQEAFHIAEHVPFDIVKLIDRVEAQGSTRGSKE